MYLVSARIQNFSRFFNAGPIKFGRQRTAIIGPNNIGKSHLLRALSKDFKGNPCRATEFQLSNPTMRTSIVNLDIGFSGSELRDALVDFSRNGEAINIPFLQGMEKGDAFQEKALEELFRSPEITCSLQKSGDPSSTELKVISISCPKILNVHFDRRAPVAILFRFDAHRGQFRFMQRSNWNPSSLHSAALRLISKIFRFDAERLNVSSCKADAAATLRADCANLAAVLDNMQPTPRFEKFQDLVSQIIPTVSHLGVRQKPSTKDEREIIIFSNSNDDLGAEISLAECGSGVGQILSILAAVLSQANPQVILIDEPNCFLHPAASKALIAALREFPQHQYILATHSFEILSEFSPQEILHLEQDGATTKISKYSELSIESSRIFMSSLGVKFSDFAGVDRCIWVEGETESEVLPKIARHFFGQAATGIAFPKVASTGKFFGKKLGVAEVIDVYRNISAGVVLLPEAVSFIFDREGRSDDQLREIKQKTGGNFEFIDRYCFENYLLSPEGIAAAFNALPTFSESPVPVSEIEDWMKFNGDDAKFWKSRKPISYMSDGWVENVDAALLLESMLADLADGREEYRKTRESVHIAQWILENEPQAFSEIEKCIKKYVVKQ